MGRPKRPPKSAAVICKLAYIVEEGKDIAVVKLNAADTYLTPEVALRLAQRIIQVAGIAEAIDRIDQVMGDE